MIFQKINGKKILTAKNNSYNEKRDLEDRHLAPLKRKTFKDLGHHDEYNQRINWLEEFLLTKSKTTIPRR